LKLAIQNADAALAISKDLPAANDIKASAAEALTKRAMSAARWYVADLWLEIWRATGVREEARMRVENELSRRRTE
jgi:hypothetical protein